jgi:hypothetical protein
MKYTEAEIAAQLADQFDPYTATADELRGALSEARCDLELAREALVLISSALRCTSGKPADVVGAVRIAAGELTGLRELRNRVEHAARVSRGLS